MTAGLGPAESRLSLPMPGACAFARRKFLSRDLSGPLQQDFQGAQPDLVVTGVVVDRGRQALAGVAGGVDVPIAQRTGGKRDAEHALFPVGVEPDGLILRHDRAEAVAPADILRAVHGVTGLRSHSRSCCPA
jgi:hypothetical protein